MNPRTFFTVVATDLKLFFADRRAVVMTLLVPIGIASFFGMIFSGGGDGDKGTIALPVADADGSAMTKKIVEKIKADRSFTVSEVSETRARELVKTGKAPVAALFPKGFGQRASAGMFGGEKAEVTLLSDPSKISERQMLAGLLTQHVASVVMQDGFNNPSPESTEKRLEQVQNSGMPADQQTALTGVLKNLQTFQESQKASGATTGADSGGGFSLPFTLKDETTAKSKEVESRAGAGHTFVGMGIQGLLFFTIDFAIGLLREKRGGLLRRVRTAPVSRLAFLASRLVAAWIISLGCLFCILAFGALAFGLRVGGSWPGFLLLAGSSAAMTASFGLMVAALGKTEQQARAASVPCVLAMSILGGAWFPAMFFPKWLQTASQVFPTRWAVDGFDNVTWRGLDFSSALLPSGIVLAFAAGFAAFAFARFRWE